MTPPTDLQAYFRAIPSIQELLQDPVITEFTIDPRYLKKIVQQEVDSLRLRLPAMKKPPRKPVPELLKSSIVARLESILKPSLRRVINATGIILHTNMGRAPLSLAARDAIAATIENYNNLEIDLGSGKRGSRMSHVEALICLLTGAEAALMVNNCAAAVFLMLNSLCRRKEVIVSRGELVEIGGSFRMPDVMQSSGARMIEIGTTNKTHPADYAGSISSKTAALLKVHASNYRVMGFTSTVSVEACAEIAHEHKLPLLYDMGSGVLEDLQQWGYPHEPLASEMVEAGADVITFSGDKILGGPQAGIIIGKENYLRKIRKNQLARALRCDKLVYAAMEASLKLYLRPQELPKTLPVATMLTLSMEELHLRASRLIALISASGLQTGIVETWSQMGSGAYPLEKLPSIAVQIEPPQNLSLIKFSSILRGFDPPLVGYIQDDRFYLNLRTVRSDEIELIADMLVSHFNTRK